MNVSSIFKIKAYSSWKVISNSQQDARVESFDEEKSEANDAGQPLAKPTSLIKKVLSRTITSTSSRKSKKNTQLVKEVYPETDLDNGLVGWDGQDDPAHPRNFSEKWKWLLLCFVSAITFLAYAALKTSQYRANSNIVHYPAPSPRPVSLS